MKLRIVNVIVTFWVPPLWLLLGLSTPKSCTYIPPISLTICSTRTTKPYRSSDIDAGTFPIDDPNPHFPPLNHVAPTACEQQGCPFYYSSWSSQDNDNETMNGLEKRQFEFPKYDHLRNIILYSATYLHQKDGRNCSTIEVDPYYILSEVLGLAKVLAQQVDNVNGRKEHTVKGDETT